MSYYNSRGNINVVTSDTTGKGLFSADGEVRVTVVSGSAWTGLYAADGSVNVVVVTSSATPLGLYHPCGAWRVVEASSEIGQFAPNGAYYVSGTFVLSDTEAKDLMGSELNGLTFSANDQSMAILDTTTPANNYDGELSAKLGSIRTSAGMTYLSSGLLGWGPENLLVRSQEFDNASWTKDSDVSVTANQIAAPDGTLTADMITDAGTSASSMRIYQDVNGIGPLTTFTFSVYAKQGSGRYILVSCGGARVSAGSGAGADRVCIFDLQDGIVTASNTYTTAMSSIGSSWYRCSITLYSDADTSADTAVPYVKQTTSPTSLVLPATSQTVYLWGAQVERAASASTYKPTTSAAYYGLRLDYDTRLTGGPGYLVEEARTNVCLYSDDLTNAAWIKTNCAAVKDQTGPDGATNSASKLTASAGNATCLQAITLGSSARFQSVFVKRVTGSGTIEMTMDNGTTWTAVTVTSAWTRVEIPSQTLANPTVGFRIVTNGDAVAFWCCQNEGGAFATSPIPTTTATVTRAVDTGGALTALPISSTEGTLVGRFAAMGAHASATARVLELSDGTTNERVLIFRNPALTMGFTVTDGGAAQVGLTSSATVANLTLSGAAAAYKLNDSAVVQAGESVATDGTCTMPTVTTMHFGNRSDNAAALNGWLRHGRYFPTRKSNADLAVLAAAA